MRVFLFLCYANMRISCVLRVCVSILYEACVTVRLRANERVCVAYVCRVPASVYACVCRDLMCESFCMRYLNLNCFGAFLTCVLCVVSRA